MRSIAAKFILPVALVVIVFMGVDAFLGYRETRSRLADMMDQKAALGLSFDLAIRSYVGEQVRPVMEARVADDEFIPETMSTSYGRPQYLRSGPRRFPGVRNQVLVGKPAQSCQPGRPRRTADDSLFRRASRARRLDGRAPSGRRAAPGTLQSAADAGRMPALPRSSRRCAAGTDRPIWRDCASICGSCLALELALLGLAESGRIDGWPMLSRVAAVSVGMLGGREILDLCYEEDAAADVDMNVVMNSRNEFIEVQGTAEEQPFNHQQLGRMLALAEQGVHRILALQETALQGRANPVPPPAKKD